jgi:hypothetical protein
MTYSISVLEGLASPLVGPPVVFPSLATFPVRRILAPTTCSSTHSVCAPPPPEPSRTRPPLAHVPRSAMGRGCGGGRGDRHSSQLRHSADTAHETSGRLHRHELTRHVCQHAANTGMVPSAHLPSASIATVANRTQDHALPMHKEEQPSAQVGHAAQGWPHAVHNLV